MWNGQAKYSHVADFETTTDPMDCRVWAFGIAEVSATEPNQVNIGNSIEEFIGYVSKNCTNVYFHNLNFDGSFILDWLFRNDYVHAEENPVAGAFSTFINFMGKFYSIEVRWKNGSKTTFKDSLKKIPMSVKAAANAFGVDLVKGEIDYHTYRPIGHKVTDEERAYIENDVLIICKALMQQFNAGMLKLTVGADSLSEYKSLIGGKTAFESIFPILPLDSDAEIRKAYRGGFAYSDDRYSRRIVGPGTVYDVNSLYPYVMRTSVLPFGIPVFDKYNDEPTDEYPLVIKAVLLTAKLKPGHIPCIQIKGSMFYNGTEYQTELNDPVVIFGTNIDFKLYEEHYDIEYLADMGSWKFHGTTGLFDDYIDKWARIKETSEGGMRTIAKLQLNSLYGKFGTNPNVTGKFPVMEDNIVRLKSAQEEFRDPTYTAMAVFITSYARNHTIRAAQNHYDRFLYADTDSLHLLGTDPVNLDVHPTKMGSWKHEYDFEQGYFLRPKAYGEIVNGTYINHIAGLPTDLANKLTFDDFENGATVSGKLMPQHVPGGIVLMETTFTLKR